MSQTMANSMMSCFLCEPNSDVKAWKDSVAWIRSGINVASPFLGFKDYNFIHFYSLISNVIYFILTYWPETC